MFRKYLLFVAVRLITVVPISYSNIISIYNRVNEIKSYRKESEEDIFNYPKGVELAITSRGLFYFLIFVFDEELRTTAIQSFQ